VFLADVLQDRGRHAHVVFTDQVAQPRRQLVHVLQDCLDPILVAGHQQVEALGERCPGASRGTDVVAGLLQLRDRLARTLGQQADLLDRLLGVGQRLARVLGQVAVLLHRLLHERRQILEALERLAHVVEQVLRRRHHVGGAGQERVNRNLTESLHLGAGLDFCAVGLLARLDLDGDEVDAGVVAEEAGDDRGPLALADGVLALDGDLDAHLVGLVVEVHVGDFADADAGAAHRTALADARRIVEDDGVFVCGAEQRRQAAEEQDQQAEQHQRHNDEDAQADAEIPFTHGAILSAKPQAAIRSGSSEFLQPVARLALDELAHARLGAVLQVVGRAVEDDLALVRL
jgi:hypothetical protein